MGHIVVCMMSHNLQTQCNQENMGLSHWEQQEMYKVWFIFCLDTGQVIKRWSITELSIPDTVIRKVEEWAEKEDMQEEDDLLIINERHFKLR